MGVLVVLGLSAADDDWGDAVASLGMYGAIALVALVVVVIVVALLAARSGARTRARAAAERDETT